MMGEEFTITYDRGGIPIELLDERDWRRAIARGYLRRDTTVTLLSKSGSQRVAPAHEVPELVRIFREFEPAPAPTPEPGPAEPAEKVAAPPPAAAAPVVPAAGAASSPSPSPSSWLGSEPVEQSGFLRERPLRSPQWRHALPIAAALLVGWLLLSVVSRSGPTPASEEVSTSPESSAAGADGPAPRPAAFETSFNCAAATLPAERAICGSPELAAQDRQMARLYEAARSRAPAAARAALEQDQRAWLRRRNACGEIFAAGACLHQAYVDRISTLQARRWERPAPAEGSASDPGGSRPRPARRPREAIPAPAAEGVLCVLPSGSEAVMSLENCRARSGVVFRD